MSLSAGDNNGSYARIPSSGKTPPPAPSAAFAKRAREAEERMGGSGRYRPPALRAMASGGSPSDEAAAAAPVDGSTLAPPTTYPQGFRRARAGTLPSNVQLAAQRFAAASNTLSSLPGSAESLTDPSQQRQLNIGGGGGGLAPARPNLRHSASVAATAMPTNSRLRSESLTLPSGGLSNAFGSSIFSSSWLSSSNAHGGGFAALDELRSEAGGDDFDVHTLDYLGLDDSHRPPPAATISELRNQAQAAIASNLTAPHSRLRASTVSNPYRSRPALPTSLLNPPADPEEDEYMDTYDEQAYHRPPLASYDSSDSNYSFVAPGFKPTDHLTPASVRPRAISVGTLEDPMHAMQRRTTAAEANQYINEISHQSSGLSVVPNARGLQQDKNQNQRMVGSVHFPNGDPQPSRASAYLLPPGASNRSVSPKQESQSSQAQTPSRSLWIGNLDTSVTSEQLIRVFAPYGAIESLRLLPEKECGFVNFVDQADAIRAKDEVLNRQGGNIGMQNGQTVRIGFGKAESAPVAPAKGGAPTSPNLNSPGGPAAQQAASASNGLNGMDAQLQSTPTRALWIGSIPSTTTPATILGVFSPYGPIESARVLTHKNCGFINFERLDDAVRARKALNGRDVLGSDVGAIRIGFAKVPVKNQEGTADETAAVSVQGIGDLTVNGTIQALQRVKGASTIPSDQQVLSGVVENYRSNLLLSMITSGVHAGAFALDTQAAPVGWTPELTEQQLIMMELSGGTKDAEYDIQALSDFRPPTMYYTTIPLVSERSNNRRWDASKLRELRKRLDSGTMTTEEVDGVAADFLDGEIVDLASDWLGNTVVQKLFEKCSPVPRFAMLERISPHLAMIGIHKNGTWAAQKIIECATSAEEISLIAQSLRPYTPPLLLDQFGNYVVQCCLRFGAPANDFIFDAIVDRMWEVAQGRFGARSMRACLESPHITLSQQRRIATAVILNSIPLATNPNGALLLTWLLDTSGFQSRYNLLAPRFTPHLSHLCTHKLASLTVLRIVNQKIEPDASRQLVEALFNSPGDHVLTDVLGDQVNGVSVVHKIITSPFIDQAEKYEYMEATKRVLIELKVIATQAYRRLIEEVGLPIPNFQPTYNNNAGPQQAKGKNSQQGTFGMSGLPTSYPSNDQGLASMMAALQMGGQNPQAGPPQLQVEPGYGGHPHGGNNNHHQQRRPSGPNSAGAFSAGGDPFNPFMRSPDIGDNSPRMMQRSTSIPSPMMPNYNNGSPVPASPMMGQYPPMSPAGPMYHQPYMYQGYPQNPQNMGAFHA
ncbi:hypothetical protein CYLTODRAFT_422292 [Cylindrobasidium torrendii FP15055 ss-10]|uniref:ARM repeat-containing protein n=1 Tax=Cylindrobasidium torrendii FP15055 ss-10 TaxID=1314674 RepID=A0A0D7BDR9_9AGAR|nr:hypothetical protein CYLTODRAFT_422292 [Cylindrobasidium torrendii FP15055 ss-10]